ncbi:MAG: hypothetical protein ACXWQR_24675, partial [Ktedonobacterales bacterium]
LIVFSRSFCTPVFAGACLQQADCLRIAAQGDCGEIEIGALEQGIDFSLGVAPSPVELPGELA